MSNLNELLKVLDLKKVETNVYNGISKDIGSPTVYGGHVLAQALRAATETVPNDRFAHSLHAYFILAGDVNQEIQYQVEIIRNGNSFTTRRVTAKQNDKAIFVLAASFQIKEEGLEHQIHMPNITPPDSLRSYADLAKDYLGEENAKQFWLMSPNRPIDFRPVEIIEPFKPAKRSPFRHVWFKSTGELPDDQHIHRQVMAYASDFNLLLTSLQPHGIGLLDGKMQIASLDHAMWFHDDAKVDDWLLMAIESPMAGGARGFSRSKIFTKEGKLVASVAQEGLIRIRG